MVLGGRAHYQRQYRDCVVPISAEPKGGSLRMAIKSGGNAFNGAGLPAAPFRTDNWPGITEAHRPY